MASSEQEDHFDLLPDPIILLILNHISDIKTLLGCRSLSKRFNSLVPLSDTLLLRVDRVISDDSSSAFQDGNGGVTFLSSLFNSILTSLHNLLNLSSPKSENLISSNSPSQILRGFDAIKNLRIELPSGDLRLDKGTSIKWIARFGKTLQNCVILAFSNCSDNSTAAAGGLKMRVLWTISALIAASARHYMVADVIKEQKFLSHLVVNDRENEGTVIMDKDGIREFRESRDDELAQEIDVWWRSNRTTVPAVGMRMRHDPRLVLSSGMVMEGATLVVVRPVGNGGEWKREAEEHGGDEWLVAEAFGKDSVYAEAVERLLKNRSYILEMNSF